MNLDAFNWIDYAILGIILFSALVSLIRGFVREAFSLIIWLGAFWIAYQFGDIFASQFLGGISGDSYRQLLGFVAVFFLTLIVGTIANYFVGCLVYQTGLSGLDRLAGIIFGVARGVLLVGILILCAALTNLNQSSAWASSQVLPHFSGLVNWLYGVLPGQIDAFAKAAEQKMAQEDFLPDNMLSGIKDAVMQTPLPSVDNVMNER